STAQHSTAQHSTAQHSTAQHSTAQHSTAQHSNSNRSLNEQTEILAFAEKTKSTPQLISIIIPSFNGKHHLKDRLPSVVLACKQSPIPTEIIVVDDNSEDDTLNFLKEEFKGNIKSFKNPQKGACSARNHGVLQSKGDILFFIDNDVYLDENFFKTAMPYLSPDMFCAACAGYKAVNPKEQLDGIKLINWKRGFFRFTNNIYNKDLKPADKYLSYGVQGAYFFIERRKFEQLNGFDTLLDPYGLEETDLTYRGLKRGWEIEYIKNVRPLHKCGGTIASKTNKRTRKLFERNRMLFIWKNTHSKALLLNHLLWLWRSPYQVLQLLKILKKIKTKRIEQIPFISKTDKQILKECAEYALSIKE
ncbi:MAG: glycosyltransferase, partial [Elusimicrobiota bacterium]|nr:glycosyltransferase [Elusimicrobiota bacterium]